MFEELLGGHLDELVVPLPQLVCDIGRRTTVQADPFVQVLAAALVLTVAGWQGDRQVVEPGILCQQREGNCTVYVIHVDRCENNLLHTVEEEVGEGLHIFLWMVLPVHWNTLGQSLLGTMWRIFETPF